MNPKNTNRRQFINYISKSTIAASVIAHNDLLYSNSKKMDIFILAGQSNMKGRGILENKNADGLSNDIPDKNIFNMSLKDNAWQAARHPLHFVDTRDNAGIGPGLSFAREVKKKLSLKKIGLVPCARGGSWIGLWNKKSKREMTLFKGGETVGNLYQFCMDRSLVSKKKGEIKAILWLQGESDSNKEGRINNYQKQLKALVANMRQDLGKPELPFICATIGSFLKDEKWPGRDKINDVLLNIHKFIPNSACADARHLKGHIGDYVHYNAESANVIGKLMAEKYLELIRK